MIFQETWEWVIGVSPYTGEPKTETRRLVFPTTGFTGHAQGSKNTITSAGQYEVGKVYAVQPGRGKKAVGRIKILEIRRDADVRNLIPHSVRREGFDCEERFLWTWVKLRDKPLYREFEGYPFQFGIKDSAESYLANEAFWLAVIERPQRLYDAVVYQFEKV